MASSKLEVLVDFGDSPDKQQVDKTIKELTSKEGVKEAQFKDGAIMVETSLPSTEILEFVTKTSGRRAVLQGFGDGQSAVAMVSGQSCCGGTVVGVVRFQQTGDVLVADGSIDGLPPSSEHGLHIHSTGDLSEVFGWYSHHHQPINVPTAGAHAFPMEGIGRLGHDPPRGPSADWWVLTTADATGTNGLTCLPKHGGARDSKFLVTHPMTDHCESCLTSTIAAERANQLRHRAARIKINIIDI
ncbi:hypothetical protein evm_008951 [Chilo suppressalis]|nr:hypothetical protein evm_008951 [Chilo suppressalis]